MTNLKVRQAVQRKICLIFDNFPTFLIIAIPVLVLAVPATHDGIQLKIPKVLHKQWPCSHLKGSDPSKHKSIY